MKPALTDELTKPASRGDDSSSAMPPRLHNQRTPPILVFILVALAVTWLAVIAFVSVDAHQHHVGHRHLHPFAPQHAAAAATTAAASPPAVVSAEEERPAPNLKSTILCQSSKGPFRIVVAHEESPKASRFLSHLVDVGFWSMGGGIAFFRVNEWITQFGALGNEFKVPKTADFPSHKDDAIRDRNPVGDKKQRVPFKRGDMNLLGGTQFTIVRKPNRWMGVEDHDTVVGRVPEEDMRNVIDRLFAYNDIIDHPHRGPGPDQTRIYQQGWAYLEREFPLVDRIIKCEWA